MAITTHASNGIIITSAAMDETLGDQTQQTNNRQVVVSDTLANLENGQIDSDATPTYVGRLCIIRQGQGDEETAYIVSDAAGSGNTRILTVHQDWTANPAQNDTIHVSYLLIDADEVTGLTYQSKSDMYTSGRRFVVGNGTDFAFFAMLDGDMLETKDNGSTTIADFVVDNNGRFQVGYLFGEVPVGGAFMVGTPATPGELVFDGQSGSECSMYDFYLRDIAPNQLWFNGTVDMRKTKLFSACYTMDLTGAVSISLASTIEGTGDSNETVECDASTVIDGMVLANTAGLSSPDDLATETIMVSNVDFVGNSLLIEVYADKTWNVVNPTWAPDTASQDDIHFDANDDNEVNEQFSLDLLVQTSGGAPLSEAQTYLFEGTINGDLPTANRQDTDGSGEASSNITKRNFVYLTATTMTVTTYGDFALKVYKYNYLPFVSALTVAAAIDQPVTLLSDPDITESVQATAISNGSGMTINYETNPCTLLAYDAGLQAMAVGETITGDLSGATGVVVKVEEGDGTAGKVLLKTRNATAFQNDEDLDGSVGGAAQWVANGVGQEFAWWIDCNDYAMTVVYDYMAAKMAEDTPDAIIVTAIEWGEDEQSQLLYKGGSGYFSERCVAITEGAFFSDRGTGTVSYFTADDGTTWTPPTSVTLEVNGVKTDSVTITHGAISGDDGVFKVGYYLRGLTSGAIGRIIEIVDSTNTVVRVISGTFSSSETVNETTDGTAGGDTGDSAATSAVVIEYVQCYIVAGTGGPEAEGTVLMNEEANQSYGGDGFYKATEPYDYVSAQPVTVRARYQGWKSHESSGSIGVDGLTVTAVWLNDPNYGLPQ